MSWVAVLISSIGLCMDIGGALLLFEYGLPSKIEDEEGHRITEGTADDELVRIRRHNQKVTRRANLGLRLLISGFVLQLFGTILSGLS